jgi:small-conductance mechanosensitive channel
LEDGAKLPGLNKSTRLNAYLEKPQERVPTLAALHANIQDAFSENGVQIMW